jgi:folate-dependent phosphoribosylglycinamide formyltransferase PurN
MRTVLICHHDNPPNREILPGFLAGFSDFVGLILITEQPGRRWRRLRHEWKRSGLRTIDVLAFQLFYRLQLAARDRARICARLTELRDRYPLPQKMRIHETDDPNSASTLAFLEAVDPDLTLARCKTLLRPEIFNAPRRGTYILHPGICPEYRNAHGCFWALALRDLERVGATLLQIDEGVDTGPIYAYYRANIDERTESHVTIQHRVVFDNLDGVEADLKRVGEGAAEAIDVSGRPSAAWGQPRLSDYLRWKRAARVKG